MADTQLLSLKWNNHSTNFRITLASLQQKELYSDATIACDGHFYPVHKLILSTCSEYFAGMFERTPCKHPVIVLKDVGHKDVHFLLSYMYGGEVSVAQADLPSLIKAAETLRIKGLAAPDELPASEENASNEKYKEPHVRDEEDRRRLPRSKRQRTSYSSGSSAPCSDNNEEDVKNIKIEDQVVNNLSTIADTESTDTVDDQDVANQIQNNSSTDFKMYRENQIEELPQVKQEVDVDDSGGPDSIHSLESSNNIPWSSNLLSPQPPPSLPHLDNGISSFGDAISSSLQMQSRINSSNYKNQVSESFSLAAAIRMGGLPAVHPCRLCPKKFQSRADAARHLRTHTGEKPFLCPHCDYKAALKGNLKSHILSRHSQYVNHS